MNIGVPILVQVLTEKGLRTGPAELTEYQEQVKADFTKTRGYWHEFWDEMLELDPELFAAYTEFSSVPWRSGTLSPKVKEFVYIAFDTAATHLYVKGLKLHIENAIGYGATAQEILEIMEIGAASSACTQRRRQRPSWPRSSPGSREAAEMLKGLAPLLRRGRALCARSHGAWRSIGVGRPQFPRRVNEQAAGAVGGRGPGYCSAAILSVLPLDTFVDQPVVRMEVVGAPNDVPQVQAEVLALCQEAEGRELEMGSLRREDFTPVLRRLLPSWRRARRGRMAASCLPKVSSSTDGWRRQAWVRQVNLRERGSALVTFRNEPPFMARVAMTGALAQVLGERLDQPVDIVGRRAEAEAGWQSALPAIQTREQWMGAKLARRAVLRHIRPMRHAATKPASWPCTSNATIPTGLGSVRQDLQGCVPLRAAPGRPEDAGGGPPFVGLGGTAAEQLGEDQACFGQGDGADEIGRPTLVPFGGPSPISRLDGHGLDSAPCRRE